MKKAISDETKSAILEAAWNLIAEKSKVDVSQVEIAAAAGVSRQTVFLAFGNRTGLLTAMVRHKDSRSPRLARLMQVAQEQRNDPEQLLDVVAAWIDYIPDIYPVAILLDAAGQTDPDADAAIADRMHGMLLRGFVARLSRMAVRHQLAEGADPVRTAEQIWDHVHIRSWRSLVVECGWTPETFKQSRITLIRRYLARSG